MDVKLKETLYNKLLEKILTIMSFRHVDFYSEKFLIGSLKQKENLSEIIYD